MLSLPEQRPWPIPLPADDDAAKNNVLPLVKFAGMLAAGMIGGALLFAIVNAFIFALALGAGYALSRWFPGIQDSLWLVLRHWKLALLVWLGTWAIFAHYGREHYRVHR